MISRDPVRHSSGDPGLVSVVMPARNAAKTIAESIRSVLACRGLGELVVVNDGSTDTTAEIINAIGDKRLRVVPGPCQGIAAALNTGFAATSYGLVARCDADDLFPADRFTWQVPILLERPEVVAVSSGFQTIRADGAPIVPMACEVQEGDVRPQLLGGRSVSHFCGWLTRREAVWQIGGAREWFVTAEDIDLMFRLAELGIVWHVPRVAYHYRLHDLSIVHTQANHLREFYEAAAVSFVAERREHGGEDRLAAGRPPTPPGPVKGGQAMSSQAQMQGQLIGLAWGQHKAGEKSEARRTIRRAFRLFPRSTAIWRHALVLHLRR